MTSPGDPQLAQVKLHPAVIVIGCFVLGVFARDVWNMDLDPEVLRVLRYMGISLEVVGLATLGFSYGSMVRSGTTIDPSRHSSKVVTSGLYAYSRNPIYLGWFMLISGMGFRSASVLVLVVGIAMLLLLHWAVIGEEERYLEKKFGEEYLRYKARVRRWL